MHRIPSILQGRLVGLALGSGVLAAACTGADSGGVFTARRGIERVLFWITIVLSVIFFSLVIVIIVLAR